MIDAFTSGFSPCAGRETRTSTTQSAAAVVPQIDHRIGQRLEGVVQMAEALEAQQQVTEPVFPAEKSRSMVQNRTSKMAGSNRSLRP
ncbi:hypothetical protein P0D88_03525 [Paraburkholderia sp. RL18-103-BIB-C]|jgi:hypothetical protein|uniref:hypothetical protein n=1 Tax=unclassified Paraburkholderia TaxID=2615204 RepID=UPI002F4DFA47